VELKSGADALQMSKVFVDQDHVFTVRFQPFDGYFQGLGIQVYAQQPSSWHASLQNSQGVTTRPDSAIDVTPTRVNV
jgi:hypothetical protein